MIGGVHQVDVDGSLLWYDAAGEFIEGRTATYADAEMFAKDRSLGPKVLEAILATLTASFERDRVDVLAHPTFSPLRAIGDPESSYPAQWQERFIALCVRFGVAIEVNESYRVPHAAFVERAKASGARFAVGSDSHGPLLELRYTLALVSQTGVLDRLRDQVAWGSSATSS